MIEHLKDKIYRTLQGIQSECDTDIGIAFSGGIDSTLLAKACKDIDQKSILLTVAFDSSRDIDLSIDVANKLDLPIIYKMSGLKELEEGLRRVNSLINFNRIALLENCVCFYYVFKLASEHKLDTVLSANGMDELFCGYDVYRRQFTLNQDLMMNLMKRLIVIAEKDKEEMDKLSTQFRVEYLCPFLSPDFVDFAMKIPIECKVKNGEDKLRKHILRQVALQMGIPPSTSLRPKKAFQYSSGVHKAIVKLAKRRGYTRRNAKDMGYRSEFEFYINNL
jgi:asparagine synthase (glutamine-hydrolysing)